MRASPLFFLIAIAFFFAGTPCAFAELRATSPNGKATLFFFLTKAGEAAYRLVYGSSLVVDTSRCGFAFVDNATLSGGMKVVTSSTRQFSERWQPVGGEEREIHNSYNELSVSLQEVARPHREFHITFRVFDNGLGFRYEFPQQAEWNEAFIQEENTEFALTGDHKSWWAPGDWDITEHLYTESPLSRIDCTPHVRESNLAQTYIPDIHAVNTPLTMKTRDGLYLAIHEAALYDYSDMTLHVDSSRYLMTSRLVGGPHPYKVRRTLPFNTPWRVVLVGERAGDLVENRIVLNLNEPTAFTNTDWINPMKYIGIWWEMHIGKSTWGMEGGKHGATTENAKRYIDFAAKYGIRGLLIEGWNRGWEQWMGEQREGIFDFVTPYPDFDLKEVVRYAQKKNVQIIGHHETASAVLTYEKNMERAFQLYKSLGISAVKTGYVGRISPAGEYHHGQWMVNHFQRVVEMAAKHGISINAHEPIKDTGIRRTWPNFISREGMRGQEFNAWGNPPNPPDHMCIVPFTRGLSAPFDYTPGIVNLTIEEYPDRQRVPHTLAKELALYVVIHSPLAMAADLPEHYERHMDAFQFIREVPVEWDETKVLNGEPGDFITVGRREKASTSWYVGSISNEAQRIIEIHLSFLQPDQPYLLTLYSDSSSAHWETNPYPMEVQQFIVLHSTILKLALAPGGGAAAAIKAATEEDARSVPPYVPPP